MSKIVEYTVYIDDDSISVFADRFDYSLSGNTISFYIGNDAVAMFNMTYTRGIVRTPPRVG